VVDNITANPGVGGATLASDEILGVQFPRAKITLGADGVNDGDVSASNPMPVGGAALTALAGKIYNHNAVFVDGSLGQLMLGKRRDSDTTTVADGDLP
jgi:hypothetical protein